MAHRYSFDDIEQYLDGVLEGEALAEFENLLTEDQELADELKRHRETRKLVQMQARYVLKDKVKNIQSAMKQQGVTGSSNFSFLKIAASIALLLTVGISYFYLAENYSADQLAENAFSPYPNRYRLMGQQEETAFMNAMNAYDTEDYAEAILLFESIPLEDSLYVPSRLYMGISYFSLNDPVASVQVLQEVLISNEENLSEVARWYLSLAYIKNEQEDQARTILDSIVSEDGFQAEEARKLLNKLNSPARKLPGVE